MMNLTDNLDEFDEESQRLLSGIITSNKILNFQNQASNNLQSIKTGGPDYRSPFHDYRNTPLGYSYLTDNPVSVFPSTGVNEQGQKGYEYYADVLACENGSQVLGSFNTNERKAQSVFLFYEKPSANKSDFGGPFYIAKMGKYFKDLFSDKNLVLPSAIGGNPFGNINSIEDVAVYLTQVCYTRNKDKVNATFVNQALMREYQFLTGDRTFEEIIGNITSIPADAIGWCAEQLEELKPTEKNYNPEAKDYSPLFPFLGVPIPVNMNKAAQFFESLGDNPFVQGAEVAFNGAWNLVKQAASKIKDASIDYLPDAFKKLTAKISVVINDIQSFLAEVKDSINELAKLGIEILKLANAFYCGIINGLISLIQCLLYILEFLLQPTITFSYQQYLERRDLLEKAEDVIDWVTDNVPKFLQGVKNVLKKDPALTEMGLILDKMKEYLGNISRYTVAFYVGIVFFEVLINILLLIFTAGEGNVIKGATYVQKAGSLLKVVTRETVSSVTMGLSDLLTFLSKFIIRFGKACAKGIKYFIKWAEELFSGLKKGKNLDEIFENSHIEGIGQYGGKILSETEIEDWAKILSKKFKTKLERVESFDNPTVLAAFDPNTNTIKYIDDVTEYFMTHESFHAEEMFKIGFKEYTKNAHIIDTPWTIENRIHQYMREKYVYERLVQHSKKHKFNPEELNTPPFGHAYQYFDTLKFKLEILLKENNIPFPN